jgi:serine phosphatase RsbU (regulator of sigma subunit)/anti-sigma regulatory factor (Ser/Thr protein kinase)
MARVGSWRPGLGTNHVVRPLYTDDDLRVLTETAQRAGALLAAARLHEDEHHLSVRLQQALLPSELLWHPNLVVEARYQVGGTLLEAGGDWYDTFEWPDGRLGVMVGDVVGHSLESVAAMGRLRAAAAALATCTDPSPAALMDALADFARGPDGTDYATATCVVVDPRSGALAWTSAGHPPVVLLAPGGQPVRLKGATTAPLVAGREGERPEGHLVLEPGSLVVLYSDGLVERRRERLHAGLLRLEGVMEGVRDAPIAEVADGLIRQLTEGSQTSDDIVVACFRFTPPLGNHRITIPAAAEQLGGLRRDVLAWLGEQGMPRPRQADVLLGLGEACTNAIEHAYPQQPLGRIDVDLANHGHHVSVAVHDRGAWRPSGQHSRFGGRGTSIMQEVSDRFGRTTTAAGTSVAMTFDFAPRERG